MYRNSRLIVFVFVSLLWMSHPEAACPRAVFFDLGDTLVQAGTGGLFVVKPGAQATIDRLQANGTRIGVITNVPAGFTRAQLNALLADPSFLDEFEVVLMSSQAPTSKPNPAIYTHAHGLLANRPLITDTAFVGETLSEIANSQIAPTSGARATGMIGIHLSASAPSALADFTIPPTDLPQLVTLIEDQCQLYTNGFE
ncbi:MAG TPA: HAD hydrolase-like protein [Pseudomonadota bacterium]|nr:HAD hydrolase-like protein [Xanthomonadales bacterium]HQW81211.1 HAD hydrolase-like protein [Pseudomonadota bacterium]